MRHLCLIYLDEKEMDAPPAAEINSLNARHLDLNDSLRRSGANFKRNPENKRPTVQVVGRDARVTIVTIAIAATFAATRARIRVV